MDSPEAEVHRTLATMNALWRNGNPSAMNQYLHPEVTMALPGFGGKVEGMEPLIASYVEFCANARVLEYKESDEMIQVVGEVAVATYRFSMVYERASYRERSRGRDFWIFNRIGDKWLAVWRTMMDLEAERESK
jgi:hypothetical protein